MNTSLLLMTVVLVAVAVIAGKRGARGVALGAGVTVLLPGWALIRSTHPVLLAALVVVLAVLVWHRRARTSATVTRWGASARRKSGVASGTDIARARGGVAMRRKAGTVRPSLHAESRRARWVQLWRLPVVEVAVELCRVGRSKVWASVEDVVLVFGGPRVGKTQWLAGRIVDAPGAVVVTSTRMDLLDQVGPLRAERGPVFVFNPVGLGGRPSTVTFDPLTGCTDPVTAAERATDMLAGTGHGYHGGGSGDREFWDDQGRRNLAALMHAAALGGLTMADVAHWLANLNASQVEITGLLRTSAEQGFVASVTQFIETNERTRTSITSTIAPAIQWLTHKPARLAALPQREGGQPFDVAALLAARGSVFMLGGEEAQVAPLVCALTGYIAREARRLAAFQPGGRLDPPLALRLDEAALICPIPLHQWTADMGGRGVSIIACFQSRAQLVDRYGEAKAATIINNSGGRVLFGGTADRDDLNYWSTMAGDRDEPVNTVDARGRTLSRTVRRVPVLAPSQLATLPAARVVVFTNNMAPVVGRAEQAWRRRDVHAFHHPDALTVRARAAVIARRGRVAGWVSTRTRPARTWAGARTGVAVSWCTGRWTALRVRVTGHGGPSSYLSPQTVPGEVTDHTGTGPSNAGPSTGQGVELGTGRGAEVIPFPSPWARSGQPGAAPNHKHGQDEDDDEAIETQDRQRDDGSPW